MTLVHAAYREMRRVLDDLGIDRVQGVLLDLGLSSDQLAWEGRGFSFSTDGPLDMRFDPDEPGPTAADLVNQMREADLAQLFFELGEERFSRRIARRIVEDRKARPIRDHRPARRAGAAERPRPGAAWADRPGHAGLPGTADRGQRRARPARRHARGDPRPAGARRTGRDHQLSLAGRSPRQVGVQDRSQADRPDQETRDRDGPGSGRQPPSAKRQTEGGGAMPEPVVIIGPATKPAKRSEGPADNGAE